MRDEGDWDIKTSVGSTGLFVAAARGLASRQPDPISVDTFAEMFCVAAGGQWADLFIGDPSATAEHALRTPGFGAMFQDFQAARTHYFDRYLTTAGDSGVRQVVVIAAGLDSRAYRLSWADDTCVYELDQPRVLEFKNAALAEHGHKPIAERREVPIDLRLDWPAALCERGFTPSVPTAWLVEGLLMYLSPAEQNTLFERIDSLSTSGSHVGIEQMDTIDPATYRNMTEDRADVGDSGGMAERRHSGAKWASLVDNAPREDAVEWFGRHGWTGSSVTLADYLTSLGRPLPEPGSAFPTPHFVTAEKTR